jgi:hypothetical protein
MPYVGVSSPGAVQARSSGERRRAGGSSTFRTVLESLLESARRAIEKLVRPKPVIRSQIPWLSIKRWSLQTGIQSFV